MRLIKALLSFTITILFTGACMEGNLPQPADTITPTETRTVTPRPTRTAIPTPLPDYPKVTPVPAWVTDFADPIIVAIAERRPDFQDDFSLNRRWYNIMSGEPRRLYAEIHDGLLFLKLPEKTRDSFIYNTRIDRWNFVLTLDFWFDQSQPEDTVRFQFDQSEDQSVAFDLSNNRNWKFQWGLRDNWESISGTYEHFPPEHIPVTIILRDTQCAVYLNNAPLVYLSNCRTKPTPPHLWPASFHLLRDTEHAVTVNFDNLKIWDLDKIPDLP